MERIWTKHYPKGVPSDIDADRYTHVVDLLEQSCRKWAMRPGFTNMGKVLTYGELWELSGHFAAFLRNDLGMKPGERIAIQMPNLLQYPVAMFGALRAGLVVVNCNPLYTARELQGQLKDSGSKALVVLANFAHVAADILKETDLKHVIVTEVGDLLPFPKRLVVNLAVKHLKKLVPAFELPQSIAWSDALARGSASKVVGLEIKGSDLAFLQYTGGTTGVSKGAMLTHRNLVANMEQSFAWMSPLFVMGEEVVFTPLPLYHVFSLTINCLLFTKAGAQNILITNPRDMGAFFDDLQKYRCTVITGVNTLFNGLLNHSRFDSVDWSHLKLAVAGAMALQSSVAARWKERTKSVIVEGYGLTEASPVICCNPVDGSGRPGTIGLPFPSTDIKIVDDGGKELPLGDAGEICARGPQVMQGYWNRLEETVNVLKDGWLHTGDVASFDKDGFARIVDRKKDMIIVSGFKVFPNEVEDVIASHPGVLEVAAVGIPDAHAGEAVKIFVVKKDPALTEDVLRAFAREKLTGYKIPRHVEFRTELPKTNVGKILRRALRAVAVEQPS